MRVIVAIDINGGDTRGAVAFPDRPWKNVTWRGYPGQWAAEGIFGMVSRLLAELMRGMQQ